MVTERTKFKKVNERKRNMPLLCAPSLFIHAPKECNNQDVRAYLMLTRDDLVVHSERHRMANLKNKEHSN
jgi:hypothetical protein